MSSNPAKQRKLRKFDKPLVIIGILTAIQALICIFWMIFDPVDVEEKQSKTQSLTLNRLCTQGSLYDFGVMHIYIALLAVVCFLLAFKGRDKETDPIVFSMLIHLFAWLYFIPVFITQYESCPIVHISGIMVSNYGVIFCHFAPKWLKTPQRACSSSAAALSDKLRYTSFFRVIPSNIYQAQALAKLMRHFNWDWIGVVSLDDDYGKDIYENFVPHAEKERICSEFHQVIPNYGNVKQHIKQVADIIQNSTAKVVVLFLRIQQVEKLFEEMIKTNTSRIWIASNTWSMSRLLMKMKGINKVGDILGTNFITGKIPGFEDYLQNLRPRPGARNDFIREYKQMRFNCSQQSEHTSPLACNVTDPQEANDDYLLHAVDVTEAYNQRVAVYAVAHAMKKLLQCNDTACSGDTNFKPYELVDILRKVNFTLDNQTYSFNNNGDFDNGYDVMMWKKNGDEKISEVVGKFLIKNGDVEIYEHKIPWNNNTVPWSRCSEPCPPGTEKNISRISCCYDCANCSEGYYSDEWVAQDEGQTMATKSRFVYLCLRVEHISMREVIRLSGRTGAQSQYRKGCSVDEAHGGRGQEQRNIRTLVNNVQKVLGLFQDQGSDILVTSCLMKFGLMVSFGGVILFLGSPNIHLCRAQQTMYGLGFTLCVSCILVKALHIFLELMSSNPAKQRKLRKFDKPFVIIGILTAIQALICIFWMKFYPVDVEEKQSKTQLLTMDRLCTQGSMYGFGVMHVYIALLAVLSFGLAFKGRDKETDPIVFSMLIHLFAWLCFIPVFITQYESRPIVQISGIMVSNYGVIFCHFVPKWFKIFLERSETLKAVKLQDDPLTDDSDSGVICRNSEDTISILSILQNRFSIAESEMSNCDGHSLHLSEVSIASFRHRRPRSQRPRSL
ncbi:G-protein coupled receptor family C group 6 member A-like [Colossoma macropomum]|uniref:G-protein coupled receptor family C group 6 member A-like n=1 Tax=Colossoma macropomum TaxID=42526 RepID=UPI001864DFB0|nr:G-protein coupled receptor family C group 6 member A-like [Colossoma macropomum]